MLFTSEVSANVCVRQLYSPTLNRVKGRHCRRRIEYISLRIVAQAQTTEKTEKTERIRISYESYTENGITKIQRFENALLTGRI